MALILSIRFALPYLFISIHTNDKNMKITLQYTLLVSKVLNGFTFIWKAQTQSLASQERMNTQKLYELYDNKLHKKLPNLATSTLSEEVVFFSFIKEELKKKKHVTNYVSTKALTTVLINHRGFAFNQKWYRPSASNSTSLQSLYLNSEQINGFPSRIFLQSRCYHVLLKPFGTI